MFENYFSNTLCKELVSQTCYERISSLTRELYIITPLLLIVVLSFLYLFFFGLRRVYTAKGYKFLLFQKNYFISFVVMLAIMFLIIIFGLLYPVWVIWL